MIREKWRERENKKIFLNFTKRSEENLNSEFSDMKKIDSEKKNILMYCDMVKFTPKNVKDWNNKGLFLYQKGDFYEALFCFDKAIEIEPEFKEAWNNRGNILFELYRYKEALLSYTRATEIDISYVYGWYNKGFILAEKFEQLEEALYCYDMALAGMPHFYPALLGKAQVLLELGNQEKILQDYFYNKLDIEELDPSLKKNKLERHKKYKQAIQCYLKALDVKFYLTSYYNCSLN